jgi:hypothetical protein
MSVLFLARIASRPSFREEHPTSDFIDEERRMSRIGHGFGLIAS